MNKKIIIFIVSLFLATYAYSMTYTPSNPKVGTVITFTTTIYSGYQLDWNFGDGTTASNFSNQITHYYKNPGTYTVSVVDTGYSLSDSTTVTVSEDRYITVSNSTPDVGQTITITLNNAKSPPIKWDFGDGTIATGAASINHTYNTEGSYTIRAYDFNGTATTPVTYTININNPKTVSWTPVSPYEGQNVHFTASHFRAATLKWDFGDGVIIQGGTTMEHIYKNFGVYIIKVYDYYGDDSNPFIGRITVKKDNRKIIVSNPNPAVGERVLLQAQYFHSDDILWDFGDGVVLMGASIMEHIYRKNGIFTVRVVDYAGDDDKIFEININVSATSSHTSSLIITGMELYFDANKKSYLIVPEKTTDVKVKTMIKYEGTGILNAYWTIDGKPYKSINQVLSFGQSIEFQIDKLPFLETGLHTISLSFVSPVPAFEKVPEIQIFVSGIRGKIILIKPNDNETFSVYESPFFKWQAYPLAINYEFLYSENGEELFNNNNKNKPIKLNDSEFVLKDKLKSGKKYYWMVKALDINGGIVAQSEIRSFRIVENIYEAFEKKSEELIGIGDKKYVLLTFEITGNIALKKYYLVRVFVNNEKVNEFISLGKNLNKVETSVEIIKNKKNSVELKVYEIGQKLLKLVSYKKIEI